MIAIKNECKYFILVKITLLMLPGLITYNTTIDF